MEVTDEVYPAQVTADSSGHYKIILNKGHCDNGNLQRVASAATRFYFHSFCCLRVSVAQGAQAYHGRVWHCLQLYCQ
eukprot:scaffold95995_cov21-Tisochrysis_lutea.AAC.1